MKNPLRRGGLRFWLVLVVLLAGRATASSVLLGSLLLLPGIALHVWAKGCLLQNQTVTQTGPYRFVRHPFYLANALVDAGIAVMSNWWVVQVLLPVWWLAIYLPKMASEERRLTGLFPGVYERYRAAVPMLLPFRRPLPSTGEGFSWRSRNIASGSEIPRVLRLLAYPPLILAAAQVRNHGLGALTDVHSLDFHALVLAGMLYLLAWEFGRHLSERRRILPTGLAQPSARAAFVVAMLTACAVLTYMETECHTVLFPLALGIFISSAVVSRHRTRSLIAAEGLLLVGLAVGCELLWLAPVPVLYYTGAILDSRLEPEPAGAPLQPTPVCLGARAYPWLLLLALLVPTAKEVLAG